MKAFLVAAGLVVILGFAVVLIPGAAVAASPYGTYPNCVNPMDAYESQAWDIDTDEHIHTGVCFPMFAQLSAPTTFDVRTLLHNNNGTATFVRWGIQDGGWGPNYISRDPLTGTGAAEEGRVDVAPFDPASNAHSGFVEFRFTSNVEDPEKGRWYTSTRWTLELVNAGSRVDYSGGPTTSGRCGTAGHYGDYQNVYIDCRDLARIRSGPVPSGFVVHLRFEHERGVATIDPNFHHGDPGSVQYSGAGGNQAVAINAAPGLHKLHIRTEDDGQDERGQPGHFAGAFVIPIQVG